MALNPLLKKYDTIIFDMDGVITSEQNYWDIAALSAYEMLSSNKYLGMVDFCVASATEGVASIRSNIFDHDRLIYAMKDCGVNSNWDLQYVTVCLLGSKRFKHSADVTQHLLAVRPSPPDLYRFAAQCMAGEDEQKLDYYQRNGRFWQSCANVFQEWYLGSKEFEAVYALKPKEHAKTPMYSRERPIIPLNRLKELLAELTGQGKRLCIGTGRPKSEMMRPLDMWDIKQYFDSEALINYDHVQKCEKAMGELGVMVSLAKPNPYMFIKAFLGEHYPDADVLNGGYIADFTRVLVVGDAGADILAAQAMPADFLAVLTGASGAKAKKYFERVGATYILNSLAELMI